MFRLRLRRLTVKRWQARWQVKQAETDFKSRFLRIAVWLGALSSAHILAMVVFEGMTVWNAFWLTTTTLTTVGYGDSSAATIQGQVATILFLYVAGIALLAQLAGEYIDWRIDRRSRMLNGLWRWHTMRDHVLILNTPTLGSNRYLELLVKQIRLTPEFSDMPIQVLTTSYPEGLPLEVRKLDVVQHFGEAENHQDLLKANADKAKFILVLAEETAERRSDSITLDVLEHLQSVATKAYVIAECVTDENYIRFKRIRANAVIRPIRAYPELMVRAMAAPGTERLLENLFVHDGDHPKRYDVTLESLPWGSVACQLITKDLGIPLGYIDVRGELITNPSPDHQVQGQALIMMVRHNQTPSRADIIQSLSTLSENNSR